MLTVAITRKQIVLALAVLIAFVGGYGVKASTAHSDSRFQAIADRWGFAFDQKTGQVCYTVEAARESGLPSCYSLSRWDK
jgi:hypothetical protein